MPHGLPDMVRDGGVILEEMPLQMILEGGRGANVTGIFHTEGTECTGVEGSTQVSEPVSRRQE